MSSVSLLRQRRSTSLSVVTAPPPSSLVISVRRAIEIQSRFDSSITPEFFIVFFSFFI
ncbi:unnamed protein product [Brassica rapa subsp. narinosa]